MKTVLEVNTDLSVTTGSAHPAQNVIIAMMASTTRADYADTTRPTPLGRFANRTWDLSRIFLVPLVVEALVVEVASVEIRCKGLRMVNKTESAALQER